MDAQHQIAAFGPPGEPGDPVRTRALASGLTIACDDLLDRSARVRGPAHRRNS